MENELYFTKIIKKWGSSLVIRFSPDEVNILNVKDGDQLEGRVIVRPRELLPQTLEMLKEEGIDESELNENDYDPDREDIERSDSNA